MSRAADRGFWILIVFAVLHAIGAYLTEDPVHSSVRFVSVSVFCAAAIVLVSLAQPPAPKPPPPDRYRYTRQDQEDPDA
jgi:hypothetical protein